MMINPLDQADREMLRKQLDENKGRYQFHEEILAFLTTIDHLQVELLKETEDKLLLESVLKEQAEGLDDLRAKLAEAEKDGERLDYALNSGVVELPTEHGFHRVESRAEFDAAREGE
jgi:hypothetical protein